MSASETSLSKPIAFWPSVYRPFQRLLKKLVKELFTIYLIDCGLPALSRFTLSGDFTAPESVNLLRAGRPSNINICRFLRVVIIHLIIAMFTG
jgi:hypothetical protein